MDRIHTLIVDDDPLASNLVEKAVARRGHVYQTHRSAEDALAAHERQPFDMVLMDWMLPGMDGLEACKRIRAGPRGDTTVILMVTGQTQPESLQTVLNAGADDYLPKPITPAQMAVRLIVAERWLAEITKRDRAEKQLEAHQKHLQSLVEQRSHDLLEAQRHLHQSEKLASVGRLAAGVAHELNTPMQYLEANLQFLQEALRDLIRLQDHQSLLLQAARRQPSLAEWVGAADRLIQEIDLPFLRHEIPQAIIQSLEGVTKTAQIVRNMRSFVRPDRQQKMAVDLAHPFQRAAEATRADWMDLATLTVEIDPDLPPVPCYPEELAQVLVNLIRNAADAIDRAGKNDGELGAIHLAARPDNGFALLSVSDSGVGIGPEIQGRIFDPFFTTKEVGQGAGQGLATSRMIVVDLHDGAIDFQSSPGKGATFYVRLPLTAETPAAPALIETQGT